MPNLSLISKFVGLYSWFMANKSSIALFVMAIVAGATALIKLLELLIAGVSVVFPNLSKEETVLNKLLSGLDAFAHSKFMAFLSGAPSDPKVTLASKDVTQPGVK